MTLRQRRIALWALLGLALAAGLAYAFRPQPVAVDVTAVERGRLRVTVDEEGETRVHDVFVLSAPVTGRARRIESHVGDIVVAGETVVVEIEPVDPTFLDVRSESEAQAAMRAAEAARELAAAELERTRAELDFASNELTRQRGLAERGALSERDLDAAQRAHRTARAAVATARAALKERSFELDRARARLLSPLDTRDPSGGCACIPVRAPVSGSVLRVLHESEGVVQAGQPLLEIGDPRDLEIVVDLLSEDAVQVEAGQVVLIEEWGGEAMLRGTVRRVEPYGFTKISALGIEEQRVNVVIDFSDPPEAWQRLGHGYRVIARIVLWDGADVLKLPLSALFRDGDRWAVFVEAGGRARLRHVERGRHNGLEAEILSGLEVAERVVLYPSDRVVDGVRIRPRS
ncbi:MAG: HlyD family efflux transporter periplasmic adaptor subunit [Deltaproteobacteria bacterium]|nr:MAG: HlyD family efflux transporter periplasmic adaptor subunit [Deltaproteobacteria bacterium]